MQAAALGQREYPKATHVEDQLYEGGFFPLRVDERLVREFHQAQLSDKLAIVEAMRDERARELGQRIIYNEWPDALPAEQRAAMDQQRQVRMNASGGPWMSIGAALAEIDALRPKASPDKAKVLDEYRQYLRALAVPHAA